MPDFFRRQALSSMHQSITCTGQNLSTDVIVALFLSFLPIVLYIVILPLALFTFLRVIVSLYHSYYPLYRILASLVAICTFDRIFRSNLFGEHLLFSCDSHWKTVIESMVENSKCYTENSKNEISDWLWVT